MYSYRALTWRFQAFHLTADIQYEELTGTITDAPSPMRLCIRIHHQAGDKSGVVFLIQQQMTTGNNATWLDRRRGFFFFKALVSVQKDICWAEVHRRGVLFLFFPWVNNLLPYLSLILLSSGVYSGKPGWAGIVSAVYFDCVKLEWMWGLVGSGVWSAHYPFYSPDVYLFFILPGMPQQLEGVTCPGHSLSFLNWHLTTALNASI